MPYMDGPATIRALRRLDPKVKIIATSGLKAEDKISDAAQLGVKTFLPKPYTAEKLLKTVAAVLKRNDLRSLAVAPEGGLDPSALKLASAKMRRC